MLKEAPGVGQEHTVTRDDVEQGATLAELCHKHGVPVHGRLAVLMMMSEFSM